MEKNSKPIIKTALVVALMIFLSNSPAFSQSRISGFVRDGQSGERLIGANILVTGDNNGTTADNNGYFSLVVKNPCVLRISYVGYKPVDLKFNIRRDTLIEANLEAGGSWKQWSSPEPGRPYPMWQP
jgi:hypothetical protein